MTSEHFSLLVLCLYAVVAVAVVAWQAWRCSAGPLIWWLYVGERLASGLLWRVRGGDAEGRAQRCPFPVDSGALIVANHRSPADPIVLWQNHHLGNKQRRIRPISYLMAREYYDDHRLNWFYRAMRAIPVARDGQDSSAVRQALKHLKAGDLVGIFPEGGINKGPPGIMEANPGVAFLALSTDAPVYPVYIDGSPVGASMVRSIFKTARTRVIYGAPLDLSAYRGKKKSQEMLQEVTDLIMTRLADLGGVPYAGATKSPIESTVPTSSEQPPEQPPLRAWPREETWRKTS